MFTDISILTMAEAGPGGDAPPQPPPIPPSPAARISPFTNDSLFKGTILENIERNLTTYFPSFQGQEENKHPRY